MGSNFPGADRSILPTDCWRMAPVLPHGAAMIMVSSLVSSYPLCRYAYVPMTILMDGSFEYAICSGVAAPLMVAISEGSKNVVSMDCSSLM